MVCKDGVQVNVKCIELINPLVVCGTCPPVNNCKNRPCEDGDPCTTGETYNRDCTICSGGVYRDTDNDGVCDGLDQCPGKDDSRDFDNDGTPDGCDVDPACDTCQPDIDGSITICQVFTNGNMSSYKGNCYDLKSIFDSDGNFIKEGSHCGPCACASIGDVDSDGDGICDSKDECPDNPNLKKMGNCSCEDEDDNGDGIADSCDRSLCSISGDAEYEWIESIMIDNQFVVEIENNGFIFHGKDNSILTTRGRSVEFNIIPTCLGMDCHLSYAIYADWNGDMAFDELDELLAFYRGEDGFKGAFIIPDNAVPNSTIRIIVDYGRISGPCDDHVEGEVEDVMIRFKEDCEVIIENFMYQEGTSLDGLGDDSYWSSAWVESDSSNGISQILANSLEHPDLIASGQKLGILNSSNASYSISRDITISNPSVINFLYMKSGGKGTFTFKLGDECLVIRISKIGEVSLNGYIGEEIIELEKVYRFLIQIDRTKDGKAQIKLDYHSGKISENSSTISLLTTIPKIQNEVVISTENEDSFLPTAQYIDELRISCTSGRIEEAITSDKGKEKAFSRKSKIHINVFPNPVIDQKFTIQIENQEYFDGSMELINMEGRKIMSSSLMSGMTTIPTKGLPDGAYLLKMRFLEYVENRTIVIL